jgi:hypothetical protein
VAMDMAEIAIRQLQAALPWSRGGNPSSSLGCALSGEGDSLDKVDMPGPSASFSDAWPAMGAI